MEHKTTRNVIFELLQDFFDHPWRVFWVCLILAIGRVLFDGSFLHLWSLHRQAQILTERIENTQEKIKNLKFRIEEAHQPQFIERAARDQFGLMKEGDLVFVFPDSAE